MVSCAGSHSGQQLSGERAKYCLRHLHRDQLTRQARGWRSSTPEPPSPPQDVFRLLAPTNGGSCSPTTLSCGPASPNLPDLLRLDEWNQPEDFWEAIPSGRETFQMVAEVLDSGDPTRYWPKLQATTHWSHWPDAGTQ
ncbi:DUF7003 family protein [Streptomyces mirabilis]|uniref:DUF7003 family protein n=1 Tax=Streptomyces mirabilis TaxID=68239 RepID=UPI0036ADD3A8